MEQFLETCFGWPTLPASILLILVCIYWLFVIIGAVDIELFDFDFDLDADIDVDADASILGLGFAPFRFLNLGSVPVMLWMSIFALLFWTSARLIDGSETYESIALIALAVVRNAGIAALVTKLVTQPLRGRFDPVEPNRAQDLIGNTCVITTGEATEKFGEAQYATDGAPLQLTVRTTEETLTKGEIAEIVDFEPEENIYFVRRANREV